jgi:hypothetical protein
MGRMMHRSPHVSEKKRTCHLYQQIGVFTVRFGSVFIKKSNQTEFIFLKKKNRNRFKPTGFGSVWFFREKTGSNRFGSVFSVWLGFFRFFFGSVRFGFSGSRLKKPKPNRSVFSKF